MASVRMSMDLRNTILSKVVAQFNTRIYNARTEIEKQIPSLHDEVIKEFITPEVEEVVKNKILHPYLHFIDKVTINYVINNENFVWNIQLRRRIPVRFGDRGSYYGFTPADSKKIKEDHRLYPKIVEFHKDYTQVMTERNTLEAKVKELLWKATTLRQVVSVWPSVLEYCPADVVAQYHTKVSYTKNETNFDELVDTDFKTTLLKAKMSDALK